MGSGAACASAMSLSALLFLDQRGKVVLQRDFRCEGALVDRLGVRAAPRPSLPITRLSGRFSNAIGACPPACLPTAVRRRLPRPAGAMCRWLRWPTASWRA